MNEEILTEAILVLNDDLAKAEQRISDLEELLAVIIKAQEQAIEKIETTT